MGINTSQLQYSIEISNKQPNETSIRRSPISKIGLKSIPKENIHTMQDAWLDSLQRNSHNLCLFTRNSSTNIYEGKTYQEIHDNALAIGSAIIHLNLFKEVQGLKLISIFAKNCEEWTILDVSNMLFGHTMVPLYDTIGLQYCLEHSEASTCFSNAQSINNLLKIKNLGNYLQNIISIDDSLPYDIEEKIKEAKIQLLYWKHLISLGKSQPLPIKKDIQNKDILSFSYTSGTTGIPKAAMLSHENFVAVLASFQFHQQLSFNSDDIHLSYLPLSHVFERIFIYALLYAGSKIHYYSGDVKKIREDLTDVKPTFFISVPRLFNRFYELISQKFARLSGIKRFLLDLGISTKLENIKKGSNSHFLYDTLIFSETKALFGGRCRFLVTSAAPISQEVITFMKLISCVPVIEGYGQTESTGASFTTNVEDPESGHTGGPTSCVEYKLIDCPELGYFSTDRNEHGHYLPQGEICIRGPSVFCGYFKETLPPQCIDKDGWLHTGDIGIIEGNNQRLRIIDRKKNIFKMQQGEYIAPEKVENVLLKFWGVEEIFVWGNSLENYCICIAFVSKELIDKIAWKIGMSGYGDEIYDDLLIKCQFLKDIEAFGKTEGLQGFEIPKKVFFIKKSFSEYGCMTSTFKLQRHLAKDYFKQEINQMYEYKIIQ